jgi:hypothetical protein
MYCLKPYRVLAASCAIGAVLLAGGQSASGATTLGSEFAIAGTLAGDQSLPKAAVNSNGGFLVWVDNSLTPLGTRIRAARLNSQFMLAGVPFAASSAVKSKTTGMQDKPDVAVLADDGAVVVWQSGVATKQIYARFFGPDGKPRKADVRVGKSLKRDQRDPAVATLSDNSVIVVWSSFDQDGSMAGIYGQRLSATGAKLGTEFLVNTYTYLNQKSPTVAALPSGFVVGWVSELQRSAASIEIYGRVFGNDGMAVTAEFPISVTTSNACANPHIAVTQNGFAAVWSQRADPSSSNPGAVQAAALSTRSWDIAGRTFDLSGNAASGAIILNTEVNGDQYAPKVTGIGSTYFAVWNSLGQDGSRGSVYGQLFSAVGTPVGTEFRVNTQTLNHQIHPAIASNGQDQFLAIWGTYNIGSAFDLAAQAFLSPVE